MRPTIIITLIFAVIQINVHATMATKSGNAMLQGTGNLVMDMTRTVEWTRDANLAQTLCKAGHPLWTSFDPSHIKNGTGRTGDEICRQEGRMNWYEARAWIKHLNTNAYLGHRDWRLPRISYGDQSCSDLVELDSAPVAIGYGCRNSEPGHLHAVLGSNLGNFMNLDEGLYWSETELSSNTSLAGVFDIKTNWQDAEGKTSDLLHVWPVHSL
ncbi:Lcl domain-containing protein [Thiolapillus sp.]